MSRQFPEQLTVRFGSKEIEVVAKCSEHIPGEFVTGQGYDDEGILEWKKANVWVNRKRTFEETREIFLHELMHGLLEAENILDDLKITGEDEETLVEGLTTGLTSLFEKNPRVLELWRGGEVEGPRR